ncbi:MAG: DoxX family membrane protein [Elusimicrobia bacterium]|nr:DoxX family membrane protein [Elusimicrobiota bacterium]
MTFKKFAGILGRLCAGGLFVYAGYVKAAAPAEEFAYAIESYGIFPQEMALFAANVLPWLEIYLGAFLISGLFSRIVSIAAVWLLAVFEILLASAIIRKLPLANCGCFGASAGNSIEFEIMQNLVFIVFAAVAYKYGDKMLSLDLWLDKK